MTFNKISIWILCGGVLAWLTACEHRVSMETTVHPDGQLDKTIFREVDRKQKKIKESFVHFIDTVHLAEWQPVDSTAFPVYLKAKEDKKFIGFKKHFASADEANQHLAAPNDSLFRVTSSFEKKFRWFFTYITYSDTYHAINRLGLPHDDFFTKEDFQFIERLPAEGKSISPADSLYLKMLNEKITDHYANRAFFEAYFNLLLEQVEKQLPGTDFAAKLKSRKEVFYKMVIEDNDMEDDFLQAFADSLQIPIRLNSLPEYVNTENLLEQKINFISTAYDGKYTHAIHMPWAIVNTNADSVAGNSAYWAPPSVKFLLTDNTLSVEARKTNYWAIGATVLLIMGVGWLLRKR
ncbi:MAG TPA: hypothetical protein PLM56_16485 [Cyclobacteriaceae bacterium]|jgi:hypothetical protein|nr:hypothetical protein [Cytophagales bacterium]HMR56521.1 hypothetical protein [Cyclobacteriaceae bacterium]HNT49518.1 hypothetical protein [Cyclobacteriaceae bacterium]HRE65301.1 hypothetical protein [Cyclobacteriaceae bacterium]HRF35105.1 hypothetical protein [Cyclobacteriaceae bacterium]